MVFSNHPEKPGKPIKVEKITDPEVVAEISESLKRFRRNQEFIEKNWHELLLKYPNKWIVVIDEQVVGAADSLDVFDQVRAKGFDTRDCGRAYMNPNPRPLILTAVSN